MKIRTLHAMAVTLLLLGAGCQKQMISFDRPIVDPEKPIGDTVAKPPIVMNRVQITSNLLDIFGPDPALAVGLQALIYRNSTPFNGPCDLHAERRDGNGQVLPAGNTETCVAGMGDSRISSNGILAPMTSGYLSQVCEFAVQKPAAVDYAVRLALGISSGPLPSAISDQEIVAIWQLFYPEYQMPGALLASLKNVISTASTITRPYTIAERRALLLLTACLSEAWVLY